MATIVATRYNPAIKTFYQRLCGLGKAKKVALAFGNWGSVMTIDLLQPIAPLEAKEGIGNEVIARLCTSTNNFPYALGSIWLRRQPFQRLE